MAVVIRSAPKVKYPKVNYIPRATFAQILKS